MKKHIKKDFGLYAIVTNPIHGYDYMANLIVEHEVAVLQLRMKEESKFQILKTAESIRRITQNSKTVFIVNDFIDIAKDSGADGVHIGQNDGKPETVRNFLGQDAIIGLSTHNLEQTEAAQNELIDYVGVGPVYLTPTKEIPDPVLGLENMRKMVVASKLPSVCIGGIGLGRIREVLQAGAHNFSVVRLINKAENPKEVLTKISDVYRRFCLYR